MKNLILTALLLTGLLSSQKSNAQTVTISGATIVKLSNASLVYVTGTLTGKKGVPITGYTIEIISSDNQTTRVVTNQPSSGGNFEFAGAVAVVNGAAPYTVKVTTNRQVGSTTEATFCSSCN